MIFGFWIVIPLIIIGMFFGLRYKFTGQDINPKVNDAMDTVANKAESLKEDIKTNQTIGIKRAILNRQAENYRQYIPLRKASANGFRLPL